MESPILLGLAGKAGAGKDTIADELVKRFGFVKASFAFFVKVDAMLKAGFTRSEVFETKPREVREWLQRHGEAMRQRDPDHWVRKLDAAIAGRHRVVISDVRYPNEVEYVTRNGGRVARVLHSGRPYPLAGTPAASHISETALDHIELPLIPNRKGYTTADTAEVALMVTFPQLLI